ncbi:solute carrier family 2, facilitated glucose transporter member 11-like isoform X2 [Pleurodeles waltl]|uniref:solute carrier family 2, facilitated glucose transporter member 11-like isoform X2 n=1 Tax=Pleurodeles waltl TaxID=8319 RepID=UPI003709ABF2
MSWPLGYLGCCKADQITLLVKRGLSLLEVRGMADAPAAGVGTVQWDRDLKPHNGLESDWCPRRVPTRNLFLAALAVGIGGSFQYGYNVSVINAPTVYIQTFINETWADRYQNELDENTLTLIWSVIVSIFTLGGLIGSNIGGSLAGKLGRKGALLTNNSIALLAMAFMGIAYPTGMFEFLIIGRFLIGINAGLGIVVQALYLGEIAPKHLRGSMALGTSVFLTGGLVTGQIIGLRELLGGEKYWPILVCTSCVPAIIQLLILPWFPESPRYLLIDRNEETKCIKALKTFHGPVNYQPELDDIRKEKHVLNGEKTKKTWEVFTDQSIKWQLIAIVVLTVGQQLSGINAIYFYATYIFTKAGIPEQNIPYATVGTGACECITALTCGILIEYAGRRILIIGGYMLMAFWCIVLTVTLTYQDFSPWIPYLSMASIFAFILSFGLGPGGVTTTLMLELFTQSSRPAALTLGGSMGWISFFVIGMIFPFIVNGLNHYCFLVFFVECSLIATFIYFIIPETKNKSFLEIKEKFKKLNRKNNIPLPEQNGEILAGTDL